MNREKKDVDHYFTSAPKSEECFGLIKTTLRGHNFEFLTSSSIFSKKRIDLGTQLLVETMVLPEKGNVLDVGCGYGAVGIVAGALNKQVHVIMTDVNMRAIRLARHNLKINHVHNGEARLGFFYEPVTDLRFNAVFSNPPVSAGMDAVKKIISGAKNVLTTEGSLQMVIRSKIGAKALPSLFEETFGNCGIIARESGYRVLVGKI